jgi:hypothetical protein
LHNEFPAITGLVGPLCSRFSSLEVTKSREDRELKIISLETPIFIFFKTPLSDSFFFFSASRSLLFRLFDYFYLFVTIP